MRRKIKTKAAAILKGSATMPLDHERLELVLLAKTVANSKSGKGGRALAKAVLDYFGDPDADDEG